MSYRNIFGCVITGLFIVGCAAPEKESPMANLLESGDAIVLSKKEYTDMIAGNTIRGTNSSSTFYREDGAKLIRTANSDTLVERKWYKDENGVMCQTLFKDNKLWCIGDDDDFKIAKSGSTIYTQWNGKLNEWELVEGNPDNL